MEGISEQQVETPGGKIKTSRLFFDDEGYYIMGGRTVAANLLNSDESNIRSLGGLDVLTEESAMSVAESKAKGQIELENKLIIAAIALLLVELLLVKMRGDI